MMKKILKYIGVAVLSSGLLLSCNEDDNTGDSTINYSNTMVTLTSDQNNVVLDETTIDAVDGHTITVTATIDSPQPIDLVIPLTKIGGTATGNDFSVGKITISAATLSGSTTVVINQTGNTEGNETLQIGAASNDLIANATVNPFTLDIAIENDYVDQNGYMRFAWDGYVFPEEDPAVSDVSFCGMDWDFYVLDSGFNLVSQDGATGSCPEEIVLDLPTLTDGTYFIFADLWANPINSFDVAVPFSITTSQGYEGELFTETTINPSVIGTTSSAPGTGGVVMEFEVSGGIITSVTGL